MSTQDLVLLSGIFLFGLLPHSLQFVWIFYLKTLQQSFLLGQKLSITHANGVVATRDISYLDSQLLNPDFFFPHQVQYITFIFERKTFLEEQTKTIFRQIVSQRQSKL